MATLPARAFTPALKGGALARIPVAASQTAGLAVELLDAGVTGPAVAGVPSLRCQDPRGDTVEAEAMSTRDAARLLDAGPDLGARLAGRGLLALGEVGVANTTGRREPGLRADRRRPANDGWPGRRGRPRDAGP